MGRAAAFCAHQLLYYCKHRSIKFVVIDDARVVGVALAAKAAVLVYAFLSLFTNVFGHKGYMEVVVPTGAANVWAQGYASGDRSAMPADMCDGGAAYDFVYDSSWVYENNRCRPFAYGEVVRKKDDGVYIQTYTTDGFVAQAGCSVDAASCASSSSAWQNYWVPGVDGVSLGVDHTFFTSTGYTERNPRAVLKRSDGSVAREAPKGGPLLLALGELLEMAGVGSLDAQNPDGPVADSVGVPLYRMTGIALQVQIYYSNMHTDFLGKETIARVKVVDLQTGWAGQGGSADYVSAGLVTTNSSMAWHDRYSYGVNVQVTFEGEHGRPSLWMVLMRLAAYIVYFGAGALAADIVAQYLLPPADSEAYWNAKNDYAHVKTISNPKPLSREAHDRLYSHGPDLSLVVAGMDLKTTAAERRAELRRKFDAIDRDRSNALDKAELARALKLTVAGPARERVDALVDDMFAQADADEDGAISFDEFVAMHERVFEVVAERGRADARGAAAPPRAGGEFDDLDPEMAKSGRVAPAS